MSRLLKGRRTALVLAGAITLLILAATIVAANHEFSDVPASAFYHDEVSYIAARDITTGCGGTKYCPNNAVTRGQMAVFLQKTSQISSPIFITDTEGAGTVDLDAAETMCVTGSHTPAYPQVARLDAWVSLEGAGALSFLMRNQVSTDGGTTWTNLDQAARSAGGVSAVDQWGHVTNSAILNLTPGTTYTFSIEVARDGVGTADATDSRCEMIVQIDNRNA